MTVNLADVGNSLMQWLTLGEEERDVSLVKAQVQASCCEGPAENVETALGVLLDISALLRANGFESDEAEVQIVIAKKVQELAGGKIALDPIVIPDEEAPKAQNLDRPAAPVALDPQDKKISLIKREIEEVVNEEKDAAALQEDNEEVKALRAEMFSGYKQRLSELLEKTEAAKKVALPAPAPKEEAPVAAAKPVEAPVVEKKDALEAPAPAIEVIVEEKTVAAEEAKPAAAPASDIDPELVAEIADTEEEIASLEARLISLEHDKEDAAQIADVKTEIANKKQILESIKAALS